MPAGAGSVLAGAARISPMTTQGHKLTESAITKATVPAGKDKAWLWDTTVAGFGLRVLTSGSKTFWFQYRAPPGGRTAPTRLATHRPPGAPRTSRDAD